MGACTAAPMMDINGVYHENLTPESVVKILAPLTGDEA
jgi:NADH:ubiquinone oxidoreductase subunit E